MIDFYIFYYELISFRYYHRNIIGIDNKLKLLNQNTSNELTSKSLILYYHVNVSYSVKGEKANDIFSTLIKQVEYFGVETIFENIKHKYRERVMMINIFDRYLKSILEAGDFKQFSENYNALLENGLSHVSIIEHVNDTRLYFFHNKEKLNFILKMYTKSNSIQIDEILVALLSNISRDPDSKSIYDNYKLKDNNLKFKKIDKIFSKNSRNVIDSKQYFL